jgi:phosphatidylinositol 4-kinase
MLTDASSIDSIKKAAQVQSLHQFFVRAYGGEDSKAFAIAQRNFIESMAGYSVVSFLMQIKDRHNGNLMLTRAGHLVHIDFGFMLATSPGGIKFESAPFKLSQELVDVMGGVSSPTFSYFKVLFFQGLKAARDHAEEVVALVELMTSYNTIACFGPDPAEVVQQIRQRMRFDLESDVEFAVYVKELIAISVDNWRTKKYDQFQTLQNGII